jgi:4-alpha-glucanotransferase
MTKLAGLLAQRRAGVLLHITSLPGNQECGDLGDDARAFVDFLVCCGITVWQTLPVTPTHDDGSPYQCMSAHAGDPRLISLRGLEGAGWLPKLPRRNAGSLFSEWRERCLCRAYQAFVKQERSSAYQSFVDVNDYWLPDYALYVALRDHHGKAAWTQWPQPLRDRDASALGFARRQFAKQIGRVYFEQFVFFQQWNELRQYANARDVALLGDMPIFVAHDSADVWANQHYFDLDAAGNPNHVAGVPPDYFSETGQRWGNPLYNWTSMEADGFQWWTHRMKTLLTQFDGVRIDHFRGFEAYWEIPSDQPTAMHGRWAPAPGHALMQHFAQVFQDSDITLIAENLGVITPEVEALRTEFNIPGMAILQFAFDGSNDNPYLPAHHQDHSVVYTGTHDNDTTASWFAGLDETQQRTVMTQCGYPELPMPRALTACALTSNAHLAVIPMQDVLELGVGYRMNTPGTSGMENWRWRFRWDQLRDDQAVWFRHMVAQCGRERHTLLSLSSDKSQADASSVHMPGYYGSRDARRKNAA